jgi:hypothetical protein
MSTEKFTAYATAELEGIESALKEWFMARRFRMERALGLKKVLDENNFTGLSLNNADVPPRELAMWKDIVVGQPVIEAQLSKDAQARKAELYSSMFDKATDADHPCRPSGMTYLRCLDTHRVDAGKECLGEFTAFDACRASILTAQKAAIDSRLVQQDVEDKRAKSLFERRQVLLETMKNVNKQQ